MVTPETKLVEFIVDFKRVANNRRLVMGVADGVVKADGEEIFHAKDLDRKSVV